MRRETKKRKYGRKKRREDFWRKSWIGGAILGDNLDFGGNFILRGGSVRGTTGLPGIFFS